MQCSKCRNNAVIFQPYSGQHLCREHFILDFEAKAKRMIRQHQWMQPGDRIAVALSGEIADNALLFFFLKLAEKRRDIHVAGIPVAGRAPDLMMAACDSGTTRIALATSLEATAASMLADILRGEGGSCLRNSAASPVALQVISPFCHIPAVEIVMYARIHGIEGSKPAIMQDDTLLRDVNAMLAAYAQRHPGAPHAILNLCDTIRQTDRQGIMTKAHSLVR